MKNLKTFFPLSFGVKDNNAFITLIVTCIIGFVACGLIGWLIGLIPIVGTLVKILTWIIGLYLTVTLVVGILVFLNVIKDPE